MVLTRYSRIPSIFKSTIKISNKKRKMSLKIPSPHDLGIHKVLKYIRPIINPLVDTFSKYRLNNAVNIADLRICCEKKIA